MGPSAKCSLVPGYTGGSSCPHLGQGRHMALLGLGWTGPCRPLPPRPYYPPGPRCGGLCWHRPRPAVEPFRMDPPESAETSVALAGSE